MSIVIASNEELDWGFAANMGLKNRKVKRKIMLMTIK